MLKERLKATGRWSAEAILAVIVVLAFFLVSMQVLVLFFPAGTAIRELVEREGFNLPGDLSGSANRDLRMDRNGEDEGLSASIHSSAVVRRMRNTVKGKRAGMVAWEDANIGMRLYSKDAIQTFPRSAAFISFDEAGHLELGENTLVIIGHLDRDLLKEKKRSVLVMVDGELRGRIAADGPESMNVEIATPSATTVITSGENGQDQAEFKVSVNPDKSSTITVFQGSAEVGSKGRKVRVEANQGVTVNLGKLPGAPQALPSPPVPVSPSGNGIFYYRDLPPEVRFTWKANAGSDAYRFVLARDPEFREVMEEERISKDIFTHGNLTEGNYYWRVSRLTGWKEGAFSKARMIRVVKDLDPPTLQVRFPGETVDLNQKTVLTGITEPGAHVFVQGEPVPIDRIGGFEHPLKLKPGINIVVVEAVDAAGNVAYHSDMVAARFGRANGAAPISAATGRDMARLPSGSYRSGIGEQGGVFGNSSESDRRR
jgi:hypothetical protein